MSDPPLPSSITRRIADLERRLRSLEFPTGGYTTMSVATVPVAAISTTSATFTRVAVAVFYATAPSLGYSVGITCPAGTTAEWALKCYPLDGASYPLASGTDTADATHAGTVPLTFGARSDYTVEFQVRRVSGAGTVAGYLVAPFTVGK